MLMNREFQLDVELKLSKADCQNYTKIIRAWSQNIEQPTTINNYVKLSFITSAGWT